MYLNSQLVISTGLVYRTFVKFMIGPELKNLLGTSIQETNKNLSDAIFLKERETNPNKIMFCSSYLTDVENFWEGAQSMTIVKT